MLLNLSRASFWLAALAAAWALIGPATLETALTIVAGVAALVAFALWRSALLANRRSFAGDAAVPQATPLNSESLLDAAAAVVRAADQAADLDAAVHAAADILRCELGAREARVLGASAMPSSMPADRPTVQLPQRVVLPVGAGAPAAWIELLGIEVPIDPQALDSLLELTGTSLRGVQRRPAPQSPAGSPASRALAPASGGEGIAGPAGSPTTVADDPAEAVEPGRKSAARVLVVEDNVVHSETTARLLRHLGCRVTMASGMLEGLHALCATQFDLVLMDTHMPGISASEALSWLRGQSQGAFQFGSVHGAPVVALVWNGSQGDAERFRELGFDDCLFKPLRLRQLRAMLSKHVRTLAPLPDDGTSGGQASGPEVLDPVALARLRELDPQGENQLLARVLKAFQTSAARLGPQLLAARETNDRAAVRLVAHTLKSSSASIGALTLSHQCAELEASIRNETAEDLGPAIDTVAASLDIVVKAIQRILDTQ